MRPSFSLPSDLSFLPSIFPRSLPFNAIRTRCLFHSHGCFPSCPYLLPLFIFSFSSPLFWCLSHPCRRSPFGLRFHPGFTFRPPSLFSFFQLPLCFFSVESSLCFWRVHFFPWFAFIDVALKKHTPFPLPLPPPSDFPFFHLLPNDSPSSRRDSLRRMRYGKNFF